MSVRRGSSRVSDSFVPLSIEDNAEAPEGWNWHRLTDLARLESGHTPSRSRSDWWGGEIPWIALPDIRSLDGRVAMETSEYTNEAGIANSAARVLPTDTVVLSRTASVGFVTIMGRPMATSQDFVNWVCGPGLDPKFLALLLRASRSYIKSLGSGAIHKTVYFPTVQAFRVCIPHITEQIRIASTLSDHLKLVEQARLATEAQLVAAKALLAAYLRSEFEGSNAEKWPATELAEISELLPSKSIATDGDYEVDAITTACLSESGFDPRGMKIAKMWARDVDECRTSQGEILVARSNTPDLVGRVAMFSGTPVGAVASDLTIRVWPKPTCDPFFLTAYLSYLYLSGYWKERAGGASGSMKKISRSQLLIVPVPFPPISEQRHVSERLTEALSSARRMRESLGQQLESIDHIPAALLRQAFSGAL